MEGIENKIKITERKKEKEKEKEISIKIKHINFILIFKYILNFLI